MSASTGFLLSKSVLALLFSISSADLSEIPTRLFAPLHRLLATPPIPPHIDLATFFVPSHTASTLSTIAVLKADFSAVNIFTTSAPKPTTAPTAPPTAVPTTGTTEPIAAPVVAPCKVAPATPINSSAEDPLSIPKYPLYDDPVVASPVSAPNIPAPNVDLPVSSASIAPVIPPMATGKKAIAFPNNLLPFPNAFDAAPASLAAPATAAPPTASTPVASFPAFPATPVTLLAFAPKPVSLATSSAAPASFPAFPETSVTLLAFAPKPASLATSSTLSTTLVVVFKTSSTLSNFLNIDLKFLISSK